MYVCMYVCMYVWLYVCMVVCMYVCMYACLYSVIWACLHMPTAPSIAPHTLALLSWVAICFSAGRKIWGFFCCRVFPERGGQGQHHTCGASSMLLDAFIVLLIPFIFAVLLLFICLGACGPMVASCEGSILAATWRHRLKYNEQVQILCLRNMIMCVLACLLIYNIYIYASM